MNRIIYKKKGERSKKIQAAMKKDRSKTPQQLNQERIQRSVMFEREMSETTQAPAQQSAQQSFYETVAAAINSQPDDDDNNYMDDTPIYQRTTTRKTWERYTIQKLVTMYLSSLASGKPSLALTNPQQQINGCGCKDKRTKIVTLYMMCGKKKTNEVGMVHFDF